MAGQKRKELKSDRLIEKVLESSYQKEWQRAWVTAARRHQVAVRVAEEAGQTNSWWVECSCGLSEQLWELLKADNLARVHSSGLSLLLDGCAEQMAQSLGDGFGTLTRQALPPPPPEPQDVVA